MTSASTSSIRTCPCCGLAVQSIRPPAGQRSCCPRCDATVERRTAHRSPSRTLALATAALMLYPFAVLLPILSVERLGVSRESSILDGIASLFADGELLVGIVVLLCSIVFPLGKLGALFALSTSPVAMRDRHRALTYHVVEWTGRWGMLDVLLVAVLVAAVKLRDLVDVQAGSGVLAFAGCVVLSLLATASFDPHWYWREHDA